MFKIDTINITIHMHVGDGAAAIKLTEELVNKASEAVADAKKTLELPDNYYERTVSFNDMFKGEPPEPATSKKPRKFTPTKTCLKCNVPKGKLAYRDQEGNYHPEICQKCLGNNYRAEQIKRALDARQAKRNPPKAAPIVADAFGTTVNGPALPLLGMEADLSNFTVKKLAPGEGLE